VSTPPGRTVSDNPDETFSPGSQLSGLSNKQREEIDAQSRPNAALIHETIRAEGESELDRDSFALLLSGLAAGLSMGFSLVLQGHLHAFLPDGPARTLISHLCYTLGFLIVVVGRQQLFTENTLTPILPLLHDRSRSTLWRVGRLWTLVLIANVLGAWIFAAVLAHTSLFGPEINQAFSEISARTISTSFGTTFLRAVFAGWLIALMVWLLPGAEGSRPLIIVIITYAVSLAGFSHVVAGSVDCLFLVEAGQATWREFVTTFFIPTLAGNIVGGVALVALLNYGQVAHEIR
jgi:formate/nitrite transporter FocA (FNT family)